MDFVNYGQTHMFIKIIKIKQIITNNFVIVFGIRPNRETLRSEISSRYNILIQLRIQGFDWEENIFLYGFKKIFIKTLKRIFYNIQYMHVLIGVSMWCN